MIFRSATRRIVWISASLVAGLLLVGKVAADSTTETPTATDESPPNETANGKIDPNTGKPFKSDIRTRMLEDLLKMREFFDTTIPGTLKKYNLVFSFSPRASDARKGEFIRLPATLRYGLSNRWEIYGSITPFCPNPINSGVQHRWGPGMTSLGLRYDWGHWGKVFDQVTVGVEGRTPLGKPPYDVIDYYAHVSPFINTSRPLPFPHTTLFTNIGYDRSLEAPWRAPAPPPPIVVRRHGLNVTPSVLYKPGEFGAFVEYSWRYIDDQVQGPHLGHEIKSGPIWDVPLWRTQSWGLPGKWQVELAGRLTFEDGQKTTSGVSLRVRWRTSLHEVLSKKSYQRIPHQP